LLKDADNASEESFFTDEKKMNYGLRFLWGTHEG